MSDVPSIDTIPDDQYEDIFEAGGNIYQAIPFSDIGGWAKKYKKHIGVVVAFIFAAYYAYQYFIKGDVYSTTHNSWTMLKHLAKALIGMYFIWKAQNGEK